MALEMRITITGDKAVISGLNNLQANLRSSLISEMSRAAAQAKSIMYSEAPVASSTLRESIEVDSKNTGTFFSVTIQPKAAYAKYVEGGRKPGSSAPPIDAIRTWLLAKGIDDTKAFLIARKIGQRGIEENPFVGRTFERIQGVIRSRIIAGVNTAVRMSL